jgi:hypothetical protein
MNKNNALMNVLRYRKSECDNRIHGIVIRVLMNYGQRISKFVRYRKNKCNLRIYDVAFSKIWSQSLKVEKIAELFISGIPEKNTEYLR